MKRILSIFCIFTLMTCVGCRKNTDKVKLNNLYTVTAEISLKDFKTTAEFARMGNGNWETTFLDPKSLNGIQISYIDNNTKISYKGLAFSLPSDNIPVNAIAKNITSILDDIVINKKVKFTKDKTYTFAQGTINDLDYEVAIDNKTNILKLLKINKIQLSAAFTNYKIPN